MSIKRSDKLEEQVVLKIVDRVLESTPSTLSIFKHGAYKMAEGLLYGNKDDCIPDDKLNDINILKDEIQNLKIQNSILSAELNSRDLIIFKLEERINKTPSKSNEIIAELEKKYGTNIVPDEDIVGLIKNEKLNKKIVGKQPIGASTPSIIELDNITCQSHLGDDDISKEVNQICQEKKDNCICGEDEVSTR
jgi:hypothetical protein